jgi:hypothetical protein
MQAVYCSRQCQNSDWKSHKGVCGGPLQLEQALPSQQVIEDYITAKQTEAASMLDLTPPPELQAALDAFRASKKRTE